MRMPLPAAPPEALPTAPAPTSLGDARSGRRAILGYLVPGLGLVAAAVATGLDFVPYHDEQYYIPLSRRFAKGISVELIRTYDGIASSPGPLLYTTYAAFIQVVGDGIRSMRSVSILIMGLFGAVAVDVGRLAGVRDRNLIWFGLAVLALPHFSSSGITVLSEPMALLGGGLAVDFWLRGMRSGRVGWFWLSALPLAVSINVRPTQLSLVLALAAVGVLTRGARLPMLAAPAVAVLAQVPHWSLWGGLYSPTQANGMIQGVSPKAGINVATLVHLVALVGFVLWPALLAAPRRVRGSRLVWAAMAVGAVTLYAAFRPDLAPRFSGPLATLGRARGGLLAPLLALPYLAGALLVAWASRLALDGSRPAADRTLAAVALSSVLIYVLSPLAFERYALTSTPFWIALVVPRIDDGRPALRAVWRAWVVVLMVTAALAIVAIDRDRPVGRWEMTAGLAPR
jgi:4-amino-4-deoxy-L-arabinose transferase-like glycosyltransferase